MAGSAIVAVRNGGAKRLRRVGRAFNPLDGVPHPLPGRAKPRPDDFAVGEDATPSQERAMRNFWWDGFFAETSDIIWLQYFSLYALAFGAGVGLIGLLAALGNLIAALSMWPGAVLAERTRRYKFIVVLTGGTMGRLTFLLLAALPWFASGNLALGLIVLAAGMRGFFGSVAMPAWQAFAAEFVPARLRGRYFASRNFARQVAGLAMGPAVGLLISQLAGFSGWQTAWTMAFALGMVSSAFYLRIPNDVSPQAATPAPAKARAKLSTSPLRDARLRSFVGTMALFQLSVMIAGPFFSVYFVKELGGSVFWVGITGAMMPAAGMLAQPILGKLNDRFGAKWLLVVSGLLMPIMPWAWILASEPWHILFINVVGGVLWSANLLASFNLALAISPEDRRPSYAGLYQGSIFFASFLGPLLGGLLIPLLSFQAVFFLSGAGRILAIVLLWRLVSEDEAGPSHEALPEPARRLPEAAAAGG